MAQVVRGAAMFALALACAPGVHAEPALSLLPLGFAIGEMRGPASRVAALVATTDALRENRAAAGRPLVVVWGPGGAAALALKAGAIEVLALGSSGDLQALERGRDAIPGSRLVAAGRISVVLSGPTPEYAHAALGSAVHASTLTISERQPVARGDGPTRVPIQSSQVVAGPGAVFEDREPRLADLDGDGVPEIVVVKSYLDRGAALAVVARRNGTWSIAAETPPTGEPQTWLNPAGIADFEGRGRPQIALVRKPHADGRLELWTYADAGLTRTAEAPGYSNHAFGSTAQSLAAPIPRDGAPPLMAIPTSDRRSLAILSLRGGVTQIARIDLPARASSGVAVLGTGPDAHVIVGLEDGRVADIRP